MTKAQILLVEDEAPTAKLVSLTLGEAGCEIKSLASLKSARETLAEALPDLLILDRGLPDGDGLDLVRELRSSARTKTLPILMLTAQNEVEERVSGFSGGADDYLGKPFNVKELGARVAAMLRRSASGQELHALSSGKLKIDRPSRKATLDGKTVNLSEREFDLLWCLLVGRGKVLSREFLLQRAWGYETGLTLNTKVVDVTLSHLKEKLGDWAAKIVSVRGMGYRLENEN